MVVVVERWTPMKRPSGSEILSGNNAYLCVSATYTDSKREPDQPGRLATQDNRPVM